MVETINMQDDLDQVRTIDRTIFVHACQYARLAQSVERQALNLMVVGSSPTVGDGFIVLAPST